MPVSSIGSLILPLVLWDDKAPECHISSMILNENEQLLFTGTTSGHIIMWEFNTDQITPISLMIGHTSIVNCLAKAGSNKEEEYLVSSSENGEMKLWEINQKKCVENIKMSNTIHKNIYSSKVNGKYTRLFCIGNYTDVLVMDPISLDILYTLVSREQHQWINALCINTLGNKQDEVIVGVSVSGTIKLWTVNAQEQKGSEIVEHEFKNCLCENASTLTSCPGKQRIFIVVCPKFFQIFDAFDFTVLCQVTINSLPKEDQTNNDTVTFISGFFIDVENILICASNGYAYLYMLPDNINPQSSNFRQKIGTDKFITTRLVCKFTTSNSTQNIKLNPNRYYGTPVFNLYDLNVNKQKYLLRGDWHGGISVWNLNDILSRESIIKQADYEMSLNKFWKENVTQDSDNIGFITTFLYLPSIDKIVYGTNDGSIIILPAIEFLIRHLFKRKPFKNQNFIKLKKHNAKVTCILYPHSEHTRYDPNFLVTGSADFSIILWNINTGEMIHRFIVQAGEILQLTVPPTNVNPRILGCIVSIASDHSVALLSLKECKPVMVASNHTFPILFIKWRPLDDYLIVKCSDGGVYVWQIETGSLDRVAHGLLGEDILHAADELVGINQKTFNNDSTNLISPINSSSSNGIPSNLTPVVAFSTPMIASNKSISNQTIALAHILQKRNFSNSIRTMTYHANKDDLKKNQSLFTNDSSSTMNFPLVMQTFHLSSRDPVNHLLLFDIDSLLTTLILEEQSIENMIKSIKTNFYKDIHNMQTASTQLMPPLYRTTPDHSVSHMRRNTSSKICDSIDIKQLNSLKLKVNYAQSIIKLTNILLSTLHIWSIDSNLDKQFSDKLNIQKPKYPIQFGRISRGAHLFVMFPPSKNAKIASKSMNLINFEETTTEFSLETNQKEPQSPEYSPSASIKSLNTELLLTILAISNSFMSLQNFIDLQLKNEDSDPIRFILGDRPMLTDENTQSSVKQTYSRLSTMYCMLADYFNSSSSSLDSKNMPTINLETLSLKWMDPSYEIREAAQTLLKSELKRIGPSGRANLIKLWEPQLTSLLKEFDDLNKSSIQQQQQLQQQMQQNVNLNQVQSTDQSQHQQQSQSGQVVVGAVTTSSSSISSSSSPSSLNESNNSINQQSTNRIKRKQYVALIILSLIGAEFGQDVNTSNNQAPFKTIPQGFSLEDHSILKRISTALSNLVTNKQLQFDITRRAAIDLIGRGFTVWEPFIQPTFILLSLLELSADAELYVPSMSVNLPLAPNADMCRISRNSLTIIANSKPKTFIITIAKEIKRINASSIQSGQIIQSNNLVYPFLNALIRGKTEILKIIERLIDNQAQDVFEILSDVIEIILFCVDLNQIKTVSLEDLFPPLFKFPMVRYCRETKRIICGCHNGRLIIYEYRASKWHFQSYPAHNGQPIASVAVSADSKYVASYSAHDNSLIFWQSSGASLFNIGSNTIKQLKVCNAAPIQLTVSCNKLASLSFQNRTLNLLYHDNRKFSYQI